MYKLTNAVAFHNNLQNIRAFEWGPHDLIAFGAEQFVFIYQYKNNDLKFFRSITRHRSSISSIRWSNPSVEPARSESFQTYICVGDTSGNCLVYDIYSGNRHAGISPDPGAQISIIDIQWSLSSSSIMYVLTSQPSLICFKVGSYNGRRMSSVETCQGFGLPFKSFNMEILWVHQLQKPFDFILMDPFDPYRLMICNTNASFMLVQLNERFIKTSQSQIYSFCGKQQMNQRLLNAEYLPFTKNRIAIILTNTFMIYDINSQGGSILLCDPGQEFSYTRNLFSSLRPDRFWISLVNGNLSRFEIDNNKYSQKRMIPPCGSQISAAVSDKLHPDRIAVIYANGSLAVFIDRGDCIFGTSMIVGLPSQIIAWDAKEDNIAFATATGMIAVFYQEKSYSYRVKDRNVKRIAFLEDRYLVVAGKRLIIIDLVNRMTKTLKKTDTPSNMKVKNNVIATQPYTNVLTFHLLNQTQKTKIFKETIISYCAHETNPNLWCAIASSELFYVINVEGQQIVTKTFSQNQKNIMGSIVDCAFNDEAIIAITNESMFCQLNTSTGQFTTLQFASSPLRQVLSYCSYLIVVDSANSCAILNSSDKKVIGVAHCPALQVQLLNSKMIAIKSSDYGVRFFEFPNLTTFVSILEIPDETRNEFNAAKNYKEMEEIANEFGDIEFITFARIVQSETGLPMASPYWTARDKFIEYELCTNACLPSFVEDYIDYLILTGQSKEAAKFVLENPTNNSILFAHACYATDSEAVDFISRTMAKVTGFEHLIARLYVLANSREKAVEILKNGADFKLEVKFIKYLFSDEEIKPFIIDWIKNKPELQRDYLLYAFIGDSHATLGILYGSQDTAKAAFYLNFLEQQGIQIEESQFAEMLSLQPIDTLVSQIRNEFPKLIHE